MVLLATIGMAVMSTGTLVWVRSLPRSRRIEPIVLDTSLQALARVTRQAA